MRGQLESEVKRFKQDLERMATYEQQRRAREGELASQMQLEQGRLADMQKQVGEMERALDAAISRTNATKDGR
jgi:hypothetical protein